MEAAGHCAFVHCAGSLCDSGWLWPSGSSFLRPPGSASTVAAVLVSGVVIFVAGIFVIGVGLIQLFTAPVLGIATAGAGCLLTALGILLSLALLWIALKVVPVLVQGLVNLVRLPFRKAGVIR